MPREGVPYPERLVCSLKCAVARIEQALGLKMNSVNGVGPDGQGDVKLISDSAALTVTDVPTQNEVHLDLDVGQLPAADVNSVNGQTGTVVLDGDDLDGVTPGNSVNDDITALQGADVTLQGNINAEALARSGADSTLQTNINAANASIANKADVSQLSDGSVTKVGTANVGTDLKPIKLVAGVPTAVTNDLVDTASAQTINAYKTFASSGGIGLKTTGGPDNYSITMENTTLVKNANPTSNNYPYAVRILDKNNALISTPILIALPANNSTGRITLSAPQMDASSSNGVSVFSDHVEVLNRAYNAGNTSDAVNIALLDAYTPMVRTTGDQKFTGSKAGVGSAFSPLFVIQSSAMDKNTIPSSTIVGPNYAFRDKNDNTIAGIYFQKDTSGKYAVILRVLQSDNSTWKYITLGASD